MFLPSAATPHTPTHICTPLPQPPPPPPFVLHTAHFGRTGRTWRHMPAAWPSLPVRWKEGLQNFCFFPKEQRQGWTCERDRRQGRRGAGGTGGGQWVGKAGAGCPMPACPVWAGGRGLAFPRPTDSSQPFPACCSEVTSAPPRCNPKSVSSPLF